MRRCEQDRRRVKITNSFNHDTVPNLLPRDIVNVGNQVRSRLEPGATGPFSGDPHASVKREGLLYWESAYVRFCLSCILSSSVEPNVINAINLILSFAMDVLGWVDTWPAHANL